MKLSELRTILSEYTEDSDGDLDVVVELDGDGFLHDIEDVVDGKDTMTEDSIVKLTVRTA